MALPSLRKEDMSDEQRPLTDHKDWLDEQEFFEVCQSYRHAEDISGALPGPTPSEAFEALKKYIRDQISVASSIPG